MTITGAIPPLVTPVEDRDGTIDTETLQELVRFLEDEGVHGLFPCGTNGEFTSLTDEERRVVLETVTDETSLPVYAGCGATSVSDTVQHTRVAGDIGANAAVVVTPHYFPTSQGGLIEFYERVANQSPLPIVLYEIPSHTGKHLSVETIERLAEHDNIIGMKDSSGDLSKLNRCISVTPSSFSILQGSTIYALTSLDFGVDGFVSGEANVLPGPFSSVYNAHSNGDRERAVSLIRECGLPLTGLVAEASGDLSGVPALKYLLSERGFDVGPPLPPLPTLTPDQRETLDAAVDVIQSTENCRD